MSKTSPIEMQEMKPSFLTRIKGFFLMHPLLVAFIVAFVFMLITGGCNKARAEEMDSQLQDYVQDYADEWLIGIDQTVLTQAMQECPYFSMYTVTDTQNYTYHFLDLYSIPNVGIPWSNYNSQVQLGKRTCSWFDYVGSDTSWNYWYCKAVTPSTTSQADNLIVYRFTSDSNSHAFLGGYKNTNMTMFKYHEDNQHSAYGYLKNGSGNTTNYGSDYYNPFRSFEYIASYGDVYLQINTTTFQTYTNSIEPITNNTDGFKVKKITRSGRDYLVADGLLAVPPTIRNGEWYLTDLQSTLAFTIVTDSGSYNYSYSFDIDDASEDFPYNGEYFKWQDEWSNLTLKWEIPIDELNLPITEYAYTENVIMTVSNNVTVNNVTIPYLGQFTYLTPVYIIGSQASDSGLENPDDAIPTTPEPNPVDQTTRDKNYHSLIYGTVLNMSGLDFGEWKAELHDGVLWYEILITQDPSLQDLINNYPNVRLDDVMQYLFGCSDKEEFIDIMEADLKQNIFSQYADYIVYIYCGSDATHASDVDYYVFETAKGRQKAISFLLDTNNIYFDKQFDLLSDFCAFGKDTLDRMDKNLFNLGEDIFTQNNSIISGLSSIDGSIGDLETVLKDLLNRILDALSNLHLSQLDAIDTKLTTIINNMSSGSSVPDNEVDTIKEAIDYYEDNNTSLGEDPYDTAPDAIVFNENMFSAWFTGQVHSWWASINNSSSNVHTSILASTFDSMRSMFNSMSSETKFINNITYYFRALSDSSESSDTDTNYMTGFFDNTFDPDSYDGLEVANE